MSKEEKKQLYKDFIESGLSISDYSKIKNIPVAVLRGLSIFYGNKSSNNEFISVKTCANPIIDGADESFIEFHINDLKLKVHQKNLSKVLKGLFYD